MRIGREAWILGIVLVLFVGFMAYYSRASYEGANAGRPTTHSKSKDGLAAALLLLQRENVRAERWERPYQDLPEDCGLLVIAEPLARKVDEAELGALRAWVADGGSVLQIVGDTTDRRGDLLAERLKMDARLPVTQTIHPPADDSPYLRNVRQLDVGGGICFSRPASSTDHTIVADGFGAETIAWKEGEGTIIAATNGLGWENGDIGATADNAVLLLNIAETHAHGDRPLVLFDEFHQGFGTVKEAPSLWAAIGASGRMAFWYCLAIFAAIAYNANRRFGTAKQLPTASHRPSTEYIASMAALFRRAGAASIAAESLARAFRRDLAHALDAPPDASAGRLADLAAQRFSWNRKDIGELLAQAERDGAAERLPESEMMHIARRMDEYRRRAQLARRTG